MQLLACLFSEGFWTGDCLEDQDDTYKDIVLGGRGEGGAFEVLEDLRAVRDPHENLESENEEF